MSGRGQEDARATECRTCQEFDLEEAVARSERDGSRETDCRVLRRRHIAAEHAEHAEHAECGEHAEYGEPQP